MATAEEVSKFLQQTGALAFPFNNVGDYVVGALTDMDLRQQTDMETNAPKYWTNGEPRMVLVLTLQTELQDNENDDGKRSVWCRGGNYIAASGSGTSSLVAVRDALKAAKVADLEVGGLLKMTHTGLGKPTSKGMNPPKLYTCVYEPPTKKVSVDDLLG